MKKEIQRSLLPAILLLVFAVLTMSCITPLPFGPKSESSLIWVHRYDALIAGRSDIVKVRLNNVEVAVLDEPETYKAIFVQPGQYEIQYSIYSKSGTLIREFSWEDRLYKGIEYVSGIGFQFGWNCRTRYFKRHQTAITSSRYDGEVFAESLVDPR